MPLLPTNYLGKNKLPVDSPGKSRLPDKSPGNKLPDNYPGKKMPINFPGNKLPVNSLGNKLPFNSPGKSLLPENSLGKNCHLILLAKVNSPGKRLGQVTVRQRPQSIIPPPDREEKLYSDNSSPWQRGERPLSFFNSRGKNKLLVNSPGKRLTETTIYSSSP